MIAEQETAKKKVFLDFSMELVKTYVGNRYFGDRDSVLTILGGQRLRLER
jgi:hypothetical protein